MGLSCRPIRRAPWCSYRVGGGAPCEGGTPAPVSQEATQEWPASGIESRTASERERATASERKRERQRERGKARQSERESPPRGRSLGRAIREGRVGESGECGCIRRVGVGWSVVWVVCEREGEYTCNQSFVCKVFPRGLVWLARKVQVSMQTRTATRVVLVPWA